MADSPSIAVQKPSHRSRVTNGSVLLQNVDGRSGWARRMRDLINLHVADLGGPDVISDAERSLIRRAATLATELERLEAQFAAAGAADPEAVDLSGRQAGTLKRLLEGIGLKRRPRDVVPNLSTHIAGHVA